MLTPEASAGGKAKLFASGTPTARGTTKLQIVRKALAYVTRTHGGKRELLVHTHRDHPEAGLQVPAGSLDEGESPAEAALRETFEESGLRSVEVVRLLKNYTYAHPSDARSLHDRFVFHLRTTAPTPHTWEHVVSAGIHDKGLVFVYRWMSVDSPEEMAVGQGDWIHLLAHAR
jgi:8-oxo-dGTP pyrophosphatase MutT (NUDIX family)